MKRLLVILWLCVLSGIVISVFWYNEWMYNLPTPVPANYKPVPNGTPIASFAVNAKQEEKPTFLHFFNPDCPCSRFNMEHVRALTNEYRQRVNFIVVILSAKKYSSAQIQNRFGIDVPVISDSAIAASCGVYSTPQAAILTTDRKLYYRGNYNRSRYCTDKKTNYAQNALDQLLAENINPGYDPLATTAYGCALPSCTKE